MRKGLVTPGMSYVLWGRCGASPSKRVEVCLHNYFGALAYYLWEHRTEKSYYTINHLNPNPPLLG